ncbi:MAG: GNAT family N-acetyltransferase [Acidothermales bacterium]|nr:GNAT family N-acetyltransferase [Acidothermales bacterium]
MLLRDLAPDELPRVLELNNAAVPAVGELTLPALTELVGAAALGVVATDPDAGGAVVGFALGFGPGAAYRSENYRYFAERLTDFHYLDRIVVDPAYFRRGVGSALYDEVERRCGAKVLACEVNLVPRNDDSLAFHAYRGFEQVGSQDTEGGKKTVSLLQKNLG